MHIHGQATRIELLNFSTPPMRAFHMTWFAFFLCFVAWFAIAPLMTVVAQEMSLTRDQIGWCIIGSVAVTIVARLFVGWLCERIGPRLAYSGLLLVSSLPVMGIGLADNYESFLLFRVAIGVIGASFVITQYHTSLMFAPNCVGTANATTAGWGNLGGGVAQLMLPMLFGVLTVGAFVPFTSVQLLSGMSLDPAVGWRMAMLLTGGLVALSGVAYYLLTQDTPAGNFRELRAAGLLPRPRPRGGTFIEACKDHRVWALFIAYAACFGIELTINNVLALYLLQDFDYFRNLDASHALQLAGAVALLFGLMNLFARTLGGVLGDRCGERWGLAGRVKWLFVALILEGLTLMLFSRTGALVTAIPALLLFSLFVQMSEGATFAVVPFVNPRALGSVAGIVGAGGNVGAVAAGFLFKSESISWSTALFVLGALVTVCSFATLAVTFSPQAELAARTATRQALAERQLQPNPSY